MRDYFYRIVLCFEGRGIFLVTYVRIEKSLEHPRLLKIDSENIRENFMMIR